MTYHWIEGNEAFQYGLSRWDCPYKAETEERDQWLLGWECAYYEEDDHQ